MEASGQNESQYEAYLPAMQKGKGPIYIIVIYVMVG